MTGKTSGKMIVFTAPSGAGKTTIVREMLKQFPDLAFSISVTTRAARSYEVDGKDYYFKTNEAFQELIKNDALLEWEEVYEGVFYGTLKSEIERIWKDNQVVIFDVDVKGAQKIKSYYKEKCLSVFIKPPSLLALFERLSNRKTESENSLSYRIEKAEKELSFEDRFDEVIINDILEDALEQTEKIITPFIETKEI